MSDWLKELEQEGGRFAALGGLILLCIAIAGKLWNALRTTATETRQAASFFPALMDMPSKLASLTVTVETIATRQQQMQTTQHTLESNQHIITSGLDDVRATLHARMENDDCGWWVSDASGRCTEVTGMLTEIIGVPESEILNESWIGAVHPDDRDRVIKAWTSLVSHGTSFREEYRYVSRDGRVTHARVTASRKIAPESREVLGFLGKAEKLKHAA